MGNGHGLPCIRILYVCEFEILKRPTFEQSETRSVEVEDDSLAQDSLTWVIVFVEEPFANACELAPSPSVAPRSHIHVYLLAGLGPLI